MKNAYVAALIDSILAGESVETVLTNLRAVLTKRGHERLWSQILKAAERELTVKLARTTPQVTVATEGGINEVAIKAALTTLGAAADAAYDTVVDETLVGGFTARVGGQVLDKSYKRVLLDLYQKITK